MPNKWDLKKEGTQKIDRQRRKLLKLAGWRRQLHCVAVDVPILAGSAAHRQNRHGQSGNGRSPHSAKPINLCSGGRAQGLGRRHRHRG